MREKKNVVKGGAKKSGTLYDANRMYAQISVSLKYIYIYIYIYIHTHTHIHTYTHTHTHTHTYIHTHTIIDHNYSRYVQQSECP